MIVAIYGLAIAFHLALGLAAALVVPYAVAHTAGLSDRRPGSPGVDLVKRSVRRGEGDPELARAFKRDAAGDWD